MTDINKNEVLRIIQRKDLKAFTRAAFHIVTPGDRYIDNWHIDAITDHLTRCKTGQIKRLMIAQPPRSLKSICTSVAYAAWRLGHDPTLRIVCASYSDVLAGDLTRQFRRVVESEWYRKLFPGTRFVKLTETECLTSRGGGRIATSVGGTFTGRGADIIIIDDPLKAGDAHSQSERRHVNQWYNETLVSRLNDKKKGIIIIVMQRLHENDLIGHLEDDPRWTRLILPATATMEEKVPIGPGRCHHRKVGDVLQPEREDAATLAKLKADMGSLAFSAQYQQQPVPLEGNLIRRDWFVSLDVLPDSGTGSRIIQSWDVATTTNASSDFSVCTTWIMGRGQQYYLKDVFREKLEYPDLKRKIKEMAKRFGANTVLIEDAGLGTSLLQELRPDRTMNPATVIGIRPRGDKVLRMEAQTSKIEAGQVALPQDAPWLDTFLQELLGFPNSRHDDQVDSVSQFLLWAGRSGRRKKRIPAAPVLIPIL